MRDTDQLDTQMLGMKIVLAHVEVKNTDMYSCVTPEGQIAFVVRTLQLIHASCCALCFDSILSCRKSYLPWKANVIEQFHPWYMCLSLLYWVKFLLYWRKFAIYFSQKCQVEIKKAANGQVYIRKKNWIKRLRVKTLTLTDSRLVNHSRKYFCQA